MEYELYMDLFFLTNFLMDYILLLLLRFVLKCSATHVRIVVGAVIGAGLTCLVVILPIHITFVKWILFHTIVNVSMIAIGLHPYSVQEYIKAYILLYISSFFIGGMMESLRSYVQIGSVFIFLAIVCYYLLCYMYRFIEKLREERQYQCRVELYLEHRKCSVRGILDTGNHLCDPYTGEPVSVIGKNVVNLTECGTVRYIPFRTVGIQDGLLPVIRIQKMCVYGKRTYWIQKPLIGISDIDLASDGSYEMILHASIANEI